MPMGVVKAEHVVVVVWDGSRPDMATPTLYKLVSPRLGAAMTI